MSAFILCLRNSLKTFRKPIIFQNIFAVNRRTDFARFTKSLNFLPLRQSRNRQDGRELFLMAGIMAMLGLDKDKEDKDVPETDEEKLVHSIKLGILAMQQGEFEKSEFLLHIALKLAQDIQHENGIYYVYTVLGDLAFQQGDFKKCERLYLDIMRREIGRGIPQNANSLVEMSLKLARIFESRDEFEKAEQGYKFCIDAQEQKLKKGVFNEGEDKEDVLGLWGMSMDYYAQFLLKQGRKPEALSQFQAAFEVCRDTYDGETHPQALVLLNSMATVASLMGNDKQAVMYFEKAAKLGREIESDDLPTFLVNLGMAKIKAGLKVEAKKACQEASKLAKRNKNEEEVKEAEICLDLVNELTKSSKLKKN